MAGGYEMSGVKFRSLAGGLGGLLVSAALSAAHAGVIEVTVDATAGPWDWVSGGLNDSYKYGPAVQDFTPPTSIDLTSVLGLTSGQQVYILYKSGLTSSFAGVPPTVGVNGYVGSIFKDDVLGSSGEPLPSNYLSGEWGINSVDPGNAGDYGIFLNALVGAVTEADGSVIFPFSVGTVSPDGPVGGPYVQSFRIGISFAIPANTKYLQLGINDDVFGQVLFDDDGNPDTPDVLGPDNTGALQVCVGTGSIEIVDNECVLARVPTNVPEPATLPLFLSGLLGLGMLAYRRRKPA